MALLNNAFTGKLNLDQQEYRVPEGDWIDALNITRDSKGDFKDTVVANIDGNQWVLYSLPFGTNKCIGQYPDKLRNRVYMFIWNSVDHHLVLYYDRALDTIVKLIENIDDTGGVNVLNFNASFKIIHTDIIYRDYEGDLLLWTDGYNPPREINVDTINNGTYTYIKDSFIELAKRPPQETPTCAYGSDTTKNANNLRRTLFQFATRWQYDDYSKTTFSTYSKIPLPIGFYGSDNDIDNTFNNYISVVVPTGDENVSKIEIAVRLSNGNLWGDFVTAVILDKSALNIPDNTTYQYLFYNDNVYPPIPLTEQVQLFDWVPQKALCQVLPNGATPVYGAITEGYNNYPVNELDVTITSENVTNIPPDADPAQLTYRTLTTNGQFEFTVSGNIVGGEQFYIRIFIPPQVGPPITGDLYFTYTAVPGDTVSTVAAALYADVPIPYQFGISSGTFGISVPANTSIITVEVIRSSPSGGTISTEKTWLWDANYIFGIVYVDEQNRDMPGVTTYTNPTGGDDDFSVTTPSFSEDIGQAQTPVIYAAINHLPPAGAVKYYWVRRRATYSSDFIQYETCDFQEDTDYYYFCLDNIAYYKTENSQFIYSSYTPTSESRIKIMAGIDADLYDGDLYNQDYLILGTVTRTLTGGSSPDDDRPFLKVKKPAVAPSPAYKQNMLVQVYTPLRNPTTEEGAVFYEWGEAYGIYTDGDGVRYHLGMDQPQNASQPATFSWEEGDVYFHQRTMYEDLVATAKDTVSLMDSNYSDFFASAVNDNGRPQVIEANAIQAFFPAMVRFGQSYQVDTTVNQINRFYFANLDEYDRSNGDIRKMFIEGRNLFVFQNFDIGVVPVLTQVVKDSANNPLQANSDQLLNKIQYPYKGKYGIGNIPESFAYGKGAKYGIDNNKGVAWRLSQDGLTPLSVVFQCNNFFVTKTQAYNSSYNVGLPALGNPTIYGVFNEYNNHVIWAFEEINRTYNADSISYEIDNFLGGQKLVTFSGVATEGITIAMRMSCGDGSNATVTYITQGGETSGDLRDIFIDLINGTQPFNSVTNGANTLRVIKSYAPVLPISVSITKSVPADYSQAPVTITFNESSSQQGKGFESFRSDHPEMYGCLNNLLYSFKNGQFWKYEDWYYNNFFGQQYDSYITPVFNGSPGMKKTYQNITLYAGMAWSAPEIKTQLNSFSGQKQESYLVLQDFREKEGNYNAAFRRDIHSIGGIVNGAPLRGNYIYIKLFYEQPSSYVYLNGAVVSYIDSPKNPR